MVAVRVGGRGATSSSSGTGGWCPGSSTPRAGGGGARSATPPTRRGGGRGAVSRPARDHGAAGNDGVGAGGELVASLGAIAAASARCRRCARAGRASRGAVPEPARGRGRWTRRHFWTPTCWSCSGCSGRRRGDCVRMMTLAPELPGALELVRALWTQAWWSSLGHSDATYEQALRGGGGGRALGDARVQRDGAAAPPRAGAAGGGAGPARAQLRADLRRAARRSRRRCGCCCAPRAWTACGW